ncbi:prepilin peptidase [Pandoraea anhela]|uniref:prepilin peptidase n=1 Tax=Pandoraea anhela TaxID=2508295 RepID=UPI001582E2E4|nr:A24 family peptidase [Pandoraea anhela]
MSIPLALALLNISTLFVLSATDAESLLLPDVLTIPLMWVGLLANVKGQFASTSSAIIGACAGYTSMWLLRRMSMILTSRERVGLGDAKLVAAAGAWLGWDALPEVALIALLSYLVYETWRKIWGKPASPLRPLGPHIALGFAYALCAGPHLLPIRFPL